MKERRREGGDSRGKEINKKEGRDEIREKRKHRREREREREREKERSGEETCCYQYPGAACAGVRLDQTDPQENKKPSPIEYNSRLFKESIPRMRALTGPSVHPNPEQTQITN